MEDAVCPQRAIVMFFFKKDGDNGSETVKRLKNVFEDRSPNEAAVYKWMVRFSEYSTMQKEQVGHELMTQEHQQQRKLAKTLSNLS